MMVVDPDRVEKDSGLWKGGYNDKGCYRYAI